MGGPYCKPNGLCHTSVIFPGTHKEIVKGGLFINWKEDRKEKALELEIRHDLYHLILKSPGLHFREIQRRMKLPTGQISYHLHYLQKVSLIKTEKDGEYLRYFAYEKIGEKEKKALEMLYQKSRRRILLFLLEHDKCNHEDIVKNLNISPSTISWHLNKLAESGIINRKIVGRKSFFSIKDRELIMKVLIEYKESFLDKLVDRFLEMWEM